MSPFHLRTMALKRVGDEIGEKQAPEIKIKSRNSSDLKSLFGTSEYRLIRSTSATLPNPRRTLTQTRFNTEKQIIQFINSTPGGTISDTTVGTDCPLLGLFLDPRRCPRRRAEETPQPLPIATLTFDIFDEREGSWKVIWQRRIKRKMHIYRQRFRAGCFYGALSLRF